MTFLPSKRFHCFVSCVRFIRNYAFNRVEIRFGSSSEISEESRRSRFRRVRRSEMADHIVVTESPFLYVSARPLRYPAVHSVSLAGYVVHDELFKGYVLSLQRVFLGSVKWTLIRYIYERSYRNNLRIRTNTVRFISLKTERFHFHLICDRFGFRLRFRCFIVGVLVSKESILARFLRMFNPEVAHKVARTVVVSLNVSTLARSYAAMCSNVITLGPLFDELSVQQLAGFRGSAAGRDGTSLGGA